MELFTIGFTKKSAEAFFDLLHQHSIQRIIDIRLRPGSQLAGFAKQEDLIYFLKHLGNLEYQHFDFLAPTAEILDGYRKDKNWARYSERFHALMSERQVLDRLNRSSFVEKKTCFLCSEHLPDQCHRRLVSELLASNWAGVTINHLS